MKKVNITISYDEEKLNALRLYLEQKGQTVENELATAADNLYSKAVPSGVREFIDLRAGMIKPTEKKKKPKPSVPATPVQDRGDTI